MPMTPWWAFKGQGPGLVNVLWVELEIDTRDFHPLVRYLHVQCTRACAGSLPARAMHTRTPQTSAQTYTQPRLSRDWRLELAQIAASRRVLTGPLVTNVVRSEAVRLTGCPPGGRACRRRSAAPGARRCSAASCHSSGSSLPRGRRRSRICLRPAGTSPR